MNQSKDTTRIYVDLLRTYSPSDQSGSIMQRYGQNIIEKANDYWVAFDRFKIPVDSIPLMIFNPEANFYTVELTYNGFSSGAIPLVYIPSTNLPVNAPKYYYIYTFDIFIEMVNKALADAYTALALLVTLPVGSSAPFFSMNHTTHIMSYFAQKNFYDDTLANPIEMFMNKTLFIYFKFFRVYYLPNVVTGSAVQFLVKDYINNIVSISSVEYLEMTTNGGISCAQQYNVAKGIAILTNNIPCNSEIFPSSGSSLLRTIGCLANFDFVYDALSLIPDTIQYTITGEYKLIDLLGTQSLNTIDLAVYWYDESNTLYPLDLNIERSMSFRLVFIKK